MPLSPTWGFRRRTYVQGSMLSLILFNLYTRDVPTNISTKLYMYADDSTVTCSSRNINLANALFQSHLNSVRESWDRWQLNVNPTKCSRMVFARVGKTRDKSDFFWGDVVIEKVENKRFLGVVLDNQMSWRSHTEEMIKKPGKQRYV